MKRNILIIVLGIITLGCVLYGSYKHLYKNKINWFDSEGNIAINFGDDQEDVTEPGHYSETLSDFSKIKIETRVSSITIKEGSSFHIETSYNRESLKPEYIIKGDTLEIEQNQKRSHFGEHNCKLLITVPAGTKLDSINIRSNVGDIEFDGLCGKKIDAEINVGEISARKIDFEDIELETNVGEVDVRLAGGNIDDYDMSLSADVGDVSVAGKSYKKSYNSRGNGSRKINIEANVGSIEVR